MEKQDRRQKMRKDFKGLLDAAHAEIGELAKKAREYAEPALAEARETIDEINADPRVKRAKRRTKETFARLGASLLTRFGTQAQKQAVERATHKRTRTKKSPPAASAPPPPTEPEA